MLNIVFKLFMESTMSGPVSYYSINLKAFKITADPINFLLVQNVYTRFQQGSTIRSDDSTYHKSMGCHYIISYWSSAKPV